MSETVAEYAVRMRDPGIAEKNNQRSDMAWWRSSYRCNYRVDDLRVGQVWFAMLLTHRTPDREIISLLPNDRLAYRLADGTERTCTVATFRGWISAHCAMFTDDGDQSQGSAA